jgi:glycyl-tRNA synthetase
MAFIVKKKIYGKEYYYLNENKRVEGKVKTKTLAYLGKTRKGAEKKMKDILEGKEKSEKPKKKEIKKVKLIHKEISIEELATFCKRKGFVYPSSEIYGGFAGFWDFGPLGVELFNNLKQEWWNYFVQIREDIVGINASIISHPRTWKASGHIESFSDIFVKCKKCGKTNKLDENEFGKVKCSCGGDYENQGKFNLMFQTKVGAINPDTAYLRGETAQAMFMDFKLIHQTSRIKLPFGIAQIGRCFRNEIAPRDFLFRSREFHIGEFEFFTHPEETECSLLDKKHLNVKLKLLDAETQENGKEILKETTIEKMLKEKRFEKWHAYWLAEQIIWFKNLGLDEIKIREHTKNELSHYSSATFDIDYEYSFGSREVAGNANRNQYDLSQHTKESNQKMKIFDEETGEKVLPRVIEPTFGMERIFLALLTKAYCKNDKDDVVLKLNPKLSPVKAAIFPIVKKKEFEKIARKIFSDLKGDFNVSYDESGSVGKRYARNDEIGTPYCITVDGDSLKNKDVTVRWRDTSKQVRIKIDKLKESLRRAINGEDILKFGKLVK